MRTTIIVSLFVAVCGTACLAGDRQQARVVVGQPDTKDLPAAVTVQVEQVKIDSKEAHKTIDRFVANKFDVLILQGVLVPWNACNDLTDCATAISEVCELFDETGETAVLNGTNGTCEGTCSNGRGVTVVCVTPS